MILNETLNITVNKRVIPRITVHNDTYFFVIEALPYRVIVSRMYWNKNILEDTHIIKLNGYISK